MAAGLEGLRILVVEDEYLVAMEIGEAIKLLGAEVIGPIGRLEPARQAARQEILDGAILDLNLNGVGGHPLADDLSARGIPFILTTGFGSETLTERFRNSPYLQKPFEIQTLKTMAANAFQRQ